MPNPPALDASVAMSVGTDLGICDPTVAVLTEGTVAIEGDTTIRVESVAGVPTTAVAVHIIGGVATKLGCVNGLDAGIVFVGWSGVEDGFENRTCVGTKDVG